MSFFPLPLRCSIQRSTSTIDRSGQEVQVVSTIKTGVKCVFLETSGNRVNAPQEGHQGVLALYLEPTVDITEGDFVINILDKTGTVIEAGPFYAESVKKIASPVTGRVHHLSLKLRGTT